MLASPLEVVWTRKAAIQLNEAYEYIAADNVAAADRIVAEVHSRLIQLATQPELGFKSNVRSSQGQIREIIVAPYRILYQIERDSNRLLVLLVWHGSRRNPRRKELEDSEE
jgi:toxin ParE1/3/4